MTEATRAPAPLRALDWRFLLPSPAGDRWRRLLLFGAAPGVAALAERERLADRISIADDEDGTADLVVVFADAAESVRTIAGSVAPDGVLYVEIDPSAQGAEGGDARVLEQTLMDARLTGLTWYATEPDLAQVRAYLPLHLPDAVGWHRRTQLGDGLKLRMADVVRRSASRLGPATGTRGRPFAVVATRGAAPQPGVLVMPEVVTLLGGPAPAGAAMLTYGGDRVLLFPFEREGREPMAVLKVPKSAALAGRTAHEQHSMRVLHDSVDASVVRAIPTPLGVAHAHGWYVAGESFARGMSIAARASDASRAFDEKADDLWRAMRWLAGFHHATACGSDSVGELWTRELRPSFDRFAEAFGSVPPSLTASVDRVAATLGAAVVPLSRMHRDFAAWNVLIDDELTVVDWEGTRDGIAAFDAVHLATTWLYMVRVGEGVPDERRCARELYSPTIMRDTAASAARGALLWYLSEMHMDHRLAPLLIAAHRVELALRRADQRRDHGDANPYRTSDDVRIVRALEAER